MKLELVRLILTAVGPIVLIILWWLLLKMIRRLEKGGKVVHKLYSESGELMKDIKEDRISMQESLNEYANNLTKNEEEMNKSVKAFVAEWNSGKRLADEIQSLNRKVDALGSRWGMQSENAFREGMERILVKSGYSVKKYRQYDEKGVIFGHPGAPVELDIVVRNGKTSLVEIKSSIGRSDVFMFNKITDFYETRENRTSDSKILISPFIDDEAKVLAEYLGIIVCTDSTMLNE